MKPKKSICFVANHESTSKVIANEINQYLGDYLEVKRWSLQNLEIPPDCSNCDIYVASSNTALNKIRYLLPKNKKILIADRALNTQNLDKILELSPDTKILIVANSQETVELAMNLLKKVGVDYLDYFPYYPGIDTKNLQEIEIAVTTGLSHLVPPFVEKTIDLGAKGFDLSTYVEIILETDLPKVLINKISQKYIKEIFNLTIRRQHVAQLNNNLKRSLEVMIDTVDEAILAINEQKEIMFINSALEKLLKIEKSSTIGKPLDEVFPQLDISEAFTDSISIVQQIDNNYYVLAANPIKSVEELIQGVIATLKPVGKVREMETKVRRELKKQGNIAKYTFGDIITKSNKLKKITELAKLFAKNELNVLIEGESGTGKELYAQAIHNASARKNEAFVAVNFAALPENLLESELFGYEDGAFTGAKKGGKPGLFEEAHNGTIFLDEIGDGSLEVQKKLLRVLEEREVRRVGGRTLTPINVRVIAATNQNLEKLVEQAGFRSDLFYRLCTLHLGITPLRERKEDILILINYFAQKLCQRNLALDEKVKAFLLNHSWPGNIRELENVVEYMCCIIPESQQATLHDLPLYLTRKQTLKSKNELVSINQSNFD